jgi:hypothetical protein
MTQQTIETFFQKAVSNDFTRDYHFRLEELQFGGNPTIFRADTLVYAKAGKLPARNIVNQTVKYAGQTFNLPGSVEFSGSESYEMEFYCSESSNIRDIFLDESRRTFDAFTGQAGFSNNGTGYPLGTIAGPLSYLTVSQLNKRLDIVRAFKLVGVSIRNVGDVAFEIAEGSGAIKSFTVSIAYHFFQDASRPSLPAFPSGLR